MKKPSKELSPEEKAKRIKRGGRRARRQNMMSKDTSIRTLSIKMGRYRDALTGLTKEHDVFTETLDELLQTVESILKLPTIMKELDEMPKEEPTEEEDIDFDSEEYKQHAIDMGAEEKE